MYRLGRNKKDHSKYFGLSIVAGLVVVVSVGAYFLVNFLNGGDSTPDQEVAITREYVKVVPNNHKTFDLKDFTISLPNDWMLKNPAIAATSNHYSWQASKKYADNRWLDIYVDSMPNNQAFNKIMPVSIRENRIVGTSTVSENCTNLTDKQAKPQSGQQIVAVPATWQNVSFLCDISNYTRNVVGVGTEDNGVQLPLAGTKTGSHKFLIIYDDRNGTPNYQILQDALTSLTLK